MKPKYIALLFQGPIVQLYMLKYKYNTRHQKKKTKQITKLVEIAQLRV